MQHVSQCHHYGTFNAPDCHYEIVLSIDCGKLVSAVIAPASEMVVCLTNCSENVPQLLDLHELNITRTV